jgi:hypothetical protein
MGQAESALVPFVFSPVRSVVPAQKVSAELPLFDSTGAKMSELEDVIASLLEHVLLCFRSQDP